ncbi:MAG: hypothetical protein IPQ08_06215 [Chitinophagaceae bacterium]|nr:hypothetical protein [Chitinophagaceae bacterium]
MKGFGMSLTDVLKQGYFLNHRLWGVLDEINARDLDYSSYALDSSQATQEYREKFTEWLKNRQPRRFISQEIPKEVLDKISKAYNGR